MEPVAEVMRMERLRFGLSVSIASLSGGCSTLEFSG